jgi:hypothetical protein
MPSGSTIGSAKRLSQDTTQLRKRTRIQADLSGIVPAGRTSALMQKRNWPTMLRDRLGVTTGAFRMNKSKISGTKSRENASQEQVMRSGLPLVRHLVAAPAALSKLPAGVALLGDADSDSCVTWWRPQSKQTSPAGWGRATVGDRVETLERVAVAGLWV